ncbi:PREDICTED: NADH-ubiquinone oxidoreductase chain 4-like, partial [Atta colombica]|uniref:NADH-ubiquinone oxidoreductase chain 4-like n=1 Tax=Atta colombica TaxID=520822 RepID=UPI00084C77CB
IMLLLETLLLAVFMVLDIMSFYIFFESILPPLFILVGIFAHVESPLGGSIVLAAIVLKLSLYGIFRMILPILPKAALDYTFVIYTIAVITIIYASFSTIRTTDVKELIAYSSVCHAAVYLIGAFSNTIQGIEGSIVLGLAHGFVSSGLFICAGGILYDRTGTRSIFFYRGATQLMPIFSILFFILALGNCGAPLTVNFVGE